MTAPDHDPCVPVAEANEAVRAACASGHRYGSGDPVTPGNLLDVGGSLGEFAGTLGVALAQWVTRDDSKPQPHIRQAANTAMCAIDAMLSELHRVRGRLMTEIRASDDAAIQRAGEYLGQYRPAVSDDHPGEDRLT